MKKILIIGANGKVGRMITRKMKESSDLEPVAMIRKESQGAYFDEMKVEHRVGSLEGSISSLRDVIKDVDGVVFTAGSGPDTGHDKTLAVDLDGAVKSIEAAKENGIPRYVMISALNTGKRDAWEESPIKPYYIAKYYGDEMLKESGLDFTIIRPGKLSDEDGSGKITIEFPENRNGVSREDVASLVLEVLENDNTIGKVIEFNQGDSPISEVIRTY